jgi:hypothetical protein
MKIIYVGKHGSGGNDDEGAIHHALEKLGHMVYRVREDVGKLAHRMNGDFLLFHKWNDIVGITRMRMPKVFWFFDLVDYPDAVIKDRCSRRISWMERTIPIVDMGFCTDGDWVQRDTSGKLFWLPQGVDERMLVLNRTRFGGIPILFTGIKNGGTQRESFVKEMESTYGSDFVHIKSGIYQEQLVETIGNSQIVVAPDAPVTNSYWSNRVYNTIGMGGFMVHPYCKKLTVSYKDESEIVYYKDRGHLHSLIRYYLNKPEECKTIARQGAQHTARNHTYRNRCELLISIVKERLGIK